MFGEAVREAPAACDPPVRGKCRGRVYTVGSMQQDFAQTMCVNDSIGWYMGFVLSADAEFMLMVVRTDADGGQNSSTYAEADLG